MKRLLLFALILITQIARAADRPNIILILTDDQGYADLGSFGSTKIKTPHLDRMATEGLRLTNFYAQPVCGVSRASLMTGSYPIRVAEPGNVKRLHTVPHPAEITMAEVLRSAGYKTGIIGKWHLAAINKEHPSGFDPTTMPNAQGFDYFYGTPLYNGFTVEVADTKLRVPILRNEEVVVPAVENWDNITADYTAEALNWIESHQAEPFFLYLAHNMPHIPLGASADFKGKSAYGPYGDAIEEIDWSTGQILAQLKALGLDENTLVIFTSDNGPWVETTRAMQPDGEAFIPRHHSGSAAPFRGWKMSTWEGGSRVPFIARWPQKISPLRVSDEILSTLDLLPTFANLTGAALPSDRVLDGEDATGFLLGHTDQSPRHNFLYYAGSLLTGVRVDQWKLVLPRPANPPGTGWWGRMIEEISEVQLFDLTTDPSETTNLAPRHPAVVAKLMTHIEAARSEIGDMNTIGTGARFFDAGPRTIKGTPSIPLPHSAPPTRPEKPNFVIIFTDDQGYGDLGSFGGDHVSTPRLDQMAAEGIRLTSFYAAAPVCSPSRAALTTGCYPKRINMATGSNFGVLLAGDPKGLHPDEVTIAEVLKSVDYRTGIFGKWHLGDQPEFLPTRQGFDEYFGLPYSHDIHPQNPRNSQFNFPQLPLVEGETVIELAPDADYLTQRITEHAVSFIDRHHDQPFFLYVPHPIPHKPLHASPAFMQDVAPEVAAQLKNETPDFVDYTARAQLLRNAIAEIDWSVGEILDTLKKHGLDENTFVIFTSDNGPPRNTLASAGPLRGHKSTVFEGGMREPAVMRWPGQIPAGRVSDRLMTTMDLYPTIAHLAGAQVPTDRIIDGKDIWPVLNADEPSPHRAFFYHRNDNLMAVRSGKWKLHLADEKPSALYNLQADIGETTNVITAHPDVVHRLHQFMIDFTTDIATHQRPAGFVANARPLSL